jgi:hypothetical protein
MTEQNGERIGIFAISRMEGGRERLIDDGHSPNTIDRIAASMTPPEMMVYQEMRDSMEKIFPKVQAIMRDLYNKEVEKVDDYFPLLRDWSRYDRKPGEAEMPHGSVAKFDALSGWQEGLANDYVRLTSKARSDFVKARQKGAKTPVKIDAFEIFEQHINDAAHFVASQRDLKRIGEFVRSPEFREKYGEVGGQMVMDWLDTYARQGGIGGFRRWKLLDTMRRSSSQAVIGIGYCPISSIRPIYHSHCKGPDPGGIIGRLPRCSRRRESNSCWRILRRHLSAARASLLTPKSPGGSGVRLPGPVFLLSVR